MKVIVRTVGERTTDECIRRASLIGEVDVISGVTPFCEVLRETLRRGLQYDQPWIPVIDADVLLFDGTIEAALNELESMDSVFCLDGRTKDKILRVTRRAGVHIFNRSMIETAMQYVRDSIKPETRCRQAMEREHGAKTHTGHIVFGLHDHEQYYRDLWRKSYLQAQKMGRTIRKAPQHNLNRWPELAETDPDYRVILAAHEAGTRHEGEIPFDATKDHGAVEAIKALGLTEKGPL